MSYKPRILLIDLETSLMEVSTFTLYPESIPHSAIKQDSYIICGCYKELGSKEVSAISVTDNARQYKKNHKNDFYVVKELADVMREADIVIAHNLKAFDLKKFNARLIYHRLPPLPPFLLIDTLSEARRVAKFSSNRLDYLGQFFGEGKKIHTSADLWYRVMAGDAAAVDQMVTYCKQDVNLLEKIYLRLRPYMKSHPHVGVIAGKYRYESCPHCGSDNIILSKTRTTASGLKRHQKHCKDCGGYSTPSIPKQQQLNNQTMARTILVKDKQPKKKAAAPAKKPAALYTVRGISSGKGRMVKPK